MGLLGVKGCAVVVALVTLMPACANSDTSRAGSPVVATTTIWADVVANVVCDGSIPVETVVPTGADPHGFEPSLADRGRMDGASLLVTNGLGLEEALEDTIDAAVEAGTAIFVFGDHIDPIASGAGEARHRADHDEPTEHDHDEATDHDEPAEHDHDEDPHFWFDPRRVAEALPALADALVAEAGADRQVVDECVQSYGAELAAVDAEIEGLVASLPPERRLLVTNHDALGYFANRYGLEVVGTVIPAASALAETNPAQLESLADLIEDLGVPVIFTEHEHRAGDAEALAARVGDVAVVPLRTGGLGVGDTYTEFLHTTAELIVAGLA